MDYLCNTIIVDFNTLFKENKQLAVKSLDKYKLLKYTARGKNPYELRREMELILEKNGGKGIKYPNLMEDWFRGKVSGDTLYKIVEDSVNEELEKNRKSSRLPLIKDVASLAFNKDNLCNILEPDEKVLKLLQKMKEIEGKKIYLVGNIDEATFRLVSEKNTFLSKFFDGIYLSYQAGFVKPEKKYFENILKKWNIHLYKSCFVDDDESESKSITSYGLNVFTSKSMANLLNSR